MPRFRSMLPIALLVLLVGCLPPRAACAAPDSQPNIKEADAAVLLDKGGNVLFQKNATKREHPASITKVMTAMVALDSGHSLDEVVELTAPDLGENSQMGDYATGDRVTLRELLDVMLVYSANDAAYNVAQYVAGSQEAFVALMNQKAASIGMEHTHFANPHGLEDDNHYSCAYDIAIMGKYALENYPHIAQCALMHSAEAHLYGEVVTLNSTDVLLKSFSGIRGIKTGAIVNNYTFLGASGRGNTQLYVAVLGCDTFMGRFDDAAELMEWGYGSYGERTFSQAGWVTRLEPYPYDFGLRSVLATEENFTAGVWPGMGPCTYETVLCRPHRLLDVSDTYGWTSWRQSGSDLGATFYTTREVPVRASSWPIFTLPLFQDTQALGRGA